MAFFLDRHLQFEAKIYLENLRLSANSMADVVSKGTVVPRPLESETRHFGIKQVEKGEISTMKR